MIGAEPRDLPCPTCHGRGVLAGWAVCLEESDCRLRVPHEWGADLSRFHLLEDVPCPDCEGEGRCSVEPCAHGRALPLAAFDTAPLALEGSR